jgi:hypothetical protein
MVPRMRKLLVVLVVLALAGVGADRVAHKVATDEAEQRLTAKGMVDPSVTVDGFPFLTQLVSRRFDEVQVTAAGLRADAGRARDVDATGLDVRAPSGGSVVVGRLRASGTITYADVLRRIGRPELSLRAAGDRRVQLRRDVVLQGQEVTVTSRGTVRAEGTRVRLVPTDVRLEGGAAVPASVRALVTDQLAVRFRVPGLPDGVRIERVTATEDGFVVAVTGEQLELSSLSPG